MNNEQSFSLILGYIEGIDRDNDFAVKNNLVKRFSLSFDTYRSNYPGMYFDADMFGHILHELSKLFVYDSVSIQFGGGRESRFLNLDDVVSEIKEKAGKENDAFLSMKFEWDEDVCHYVETEFYVNSGGPYPYHDSYTFAFYSAGYDKDKVEKCIREVSANHNYSLKQVIPGLDCPKITLIHKLKNLFS